MYDHSRMSHPTSYLMQGRLWSLGLLFVSESRVYTSPYTTWMQALQCRLGLVCYTREAGMWHGASKGHLARARVCLNDLEESSKSI